MKTLDKAKTQAVMNKATVANLRKAAEKDGIELPAKANKEQVIDAMLIHYFPPVAEKPKNETKGNVLKMAKAAKKIPAQRPKLAQVFQALKAAHDGKETIAGIKLEMWKSRPNGADYDGMTIRFEGETIGGVDAAILSTIQGALKGAGVEMTCFVLRKGGSASLFI